jgi:regulator of sigma E protease
VNIVLAFAILFGVYLVGVQQVDQKVGEIKPGTPAAKVLRPGDEIVAVDGHRFSGLGQEDRLLKFRKLIAAHKCAGAQVDGCKATTPVTIVVRRDGVDRTVSVKPEYSKEEGRALLGFTYGLEPVSFAAGAAANHAWDSMWMVASGTAHVFAHIFEAKQRRQISGIVGTSDVAHQAVDTGATQALLLLALVSLSLGLVNLLPILPLDGGHIFWSVVEKLRGEPVSLRVMERASIIGFALVAMLFFIGLSNDIGRITGEGFNVR